MVYQGLAKGMKELVLEGDLHLLYLLAPVTHVEPIWNQFLDVYERLDSNLKHAAQLIGADMGYVVKCITKAPTGEDSKVEGGREKREEGRRRGMVVSPRICPRQLFAANSSSSLVGCFYIIGFDQ